MRSYGSYFILCRFGGRCPFVFLLPRRQQYPHFVCPRQAQHPRFGTVPDRRPAVAVVVVAAAARPGSSREITYVVGPCSRACALRAAADGCVAWGRNGGVATMATGRGSSRGHGEWWSRQPDLSLDRAQFGRRRRGRRRASIAPQSQWRTVRAASGPPQPSPPHRHGSIVGHHRHLCAAAVFRYPLRSPLLGVPFKRAGRLSVLAVRLSVCFARFLCLSVLPGRPFVCSLVCLPVCFARLLACPFCSSAAAHAAVCFLALCFLPGRDDACFQHVRLVPYQQDRCEAWGEFFSLADVFFGG